MVCARRCRPRRIAQGIEDLRLPLLVPGLTSDVAPELAAIARLGNGKRCREHKVGVVLLLRVGVMGEVITAIGVRVCEYWKSAKPLAEGHIAFHVARQAAVCTVVHEDGEA